MKKFLKYTVGALVLLVLIFFGLGLLNPTIAYDCEVIVEKPAAESWAVMSDESKLTDWLMGYTKSELISGVKGEVGAVSNVYMDDNGQEMVIKETVVEVIPNQLLNMDFDNEFMHMSYKMHLREEAGKTYIKTETDTQGAGLFAKSVMAVFKGSMVKQEETNLSNLKKTIEKNTKNYFAATE